MAYAENKNLWINGSSVYQSAGSMEQAQFLEHARIETMMCIPWSDSVLELGTSESMPENADLMNKIHFFLSKRLLPAPGHANHSTSATTQVPHISFSQLPLNVQQTSSAEISMMNPAPFQSVSPIRHLSETLSQNFELNPLNQIRRSSSMSSLNTDMFLQQHEDNDGKEVGDGLDTDMLVKDLSWRLPLTGTADIHQPQASSRPGDQPLMTTLGNYRSQSVTTSSSVSSLEDTSGKLSVDSPEQNISLLASSQRYTSNSNTSSSPKRGTSSNSPEIQLEDTSTGPGLASLQRLRAEDEIQRALSLMLAENERLDTQEQWRQPYNPSQETDGIRQIHLQGSAVVQNNTSTEAVPNAMQSNPQAQGPFKSWRHTRVLAPILERNDRTNQLLLRRCIDMMKQIPNLQRGIQTEDVVVQSVNQQGSRLPSSPSPETVTDIGPSQQAFVQVDPPRLRRARGGLRMANTGPVHAGHDEAAMNHMMAERRRRVKQKENFAALRKLVPIISKADKASILGDAIVYLKSLEKKIEELEASKTETEKSFENLKSSYEQLEQRNKELESMISGNDNFAHMRSSRLHSMQPF